MSNLSQILRFFFVPSLRGAFAYTYQKAKGISFRYLMHDLFSVLQQVGLMLIFAIIASVIFIVLPQGIDTLLVVIENLDAGRPENYLFLLLTLFIWSVVSEFGVRYAIYVSDNSGKSLTDARVTWRKTVQRVVSGSCLLWPTVLVGISLLISFGRHKDLGAIALPYVVAFTGLYVLFSVLTNLYFIKAEASKPRLNLRRLFPTAESLPATEYNWVSRLYGIYNNYVYSLPNQGQFNEPESGLVAQFNNTFNTSDDLRNNFPQSKVPSNDTKVPAEFELISFSPQLPAHPHTLQWTYRIPAGFYKNLHKQVVMVALLSLIVFTVISIIPVSTNWEGSNFFEMLGAPALVALAFACWIGMYVGVLYLDFARLRKWPVSIRFLLLCLLIYSSVSNKDHPVREELQQADLITKRPVLKDHFSRWFSQYKAELDAFHPASRLAPAGADSVKADSVSRRYPVIFVCAEGGALRTGGFTALYLTKLQKRLEHDNIDLKRSIYAMSGVSGGALGLGLFNAVAYGNSSQELRYKNSLDSAAFDFFKGDYIAPVVGKMFFGDLLNLFLPWHINRLDRAIAMEEAWENRYSKLLSPNSSRNIFSAHFDTLNVTKNNKPLVIFNTDEVETGQQCWIMNAAPDGVWGSGQRDLLAGKIKGNIAYSTGINFSTRFPLFSPGGMIKQACRKYHYLDGGYVENTGAGSMLEMLKALQLQHSNLFAQIRPVVIFLRFSDQLAPEDGSANLNFGNEIFEVIGGIYNARKGRSDAAVHDLRDVIEGMEGDFIDAPLSASQKDVPMNWILSEQSMNNIVKDVEFKLKDMADIKNRLAFDKIKYLPFSATKEAALPKQ
ncbi:hypothetical protein [Mucilaginibacter sp. PAMB04168]|uniref:hypothetical protein n=1 Tax=Mucilaginibacter sp. PAMB04168 TaxID=3138567 RepID=UPI0031F60D94